jgi:ATP-binding cassette subfamily F protein uup
VRDLPGGVEEYLALRRSAAEPSPPPAGAASTGDTRAARKELARLERQLSKLSTQEEKLHARMAAQATDHEAVLALDAELRALHDERAALEEQWLEAAELA